MVDLGPIRKPIYQFLNSFVNQNLQNTPLDSKHHMPLIFCLEFLFISVRRGDLVLQGISVVIGNAEHDRKHLQLQKT